MPVCKITFEHGLTHCLDMNGHKWNNFAFHDHILVVMVTSRRCVCQAYVRIVCFKSWCLLYMLSDSTNAWKVTYS